MPLLFFIFSIPDITTIIQIITTMAEEEVIKVEVVFVAEEAIEADFRTNKTTIKIILSTTTRQLTGNHLQNFLHQKW